MYMCRRLPIAQLIARKQYFEYKLQFSSGGVDALNKPQLIAELTVIKLNMNKLYMQLSFTVNLLLFFHIQNTNHRLISRSWCFCRKFKKIWIHWFAHMKDSTAKRILRAQQQQPRRWTDRVGTSAPTVVAILLTCYWYQHSCLLTILVVHCKSTRLHRMAAWGGLASVVSLLVIS